jgi:predicted TIM-barrel fold metal-dependent hydrolase
MRVFDSDAHISEGAGIFADKYLDPAFRTRRPRIVGYDGTAHWVIDSQIFPRWTGRGSHFLGTPTRYGDNRTDLTKSKPESIESQEFHSAAARIRDLDAEQIDVQVIYPSLFLVWPLTTDPDFAAALCRSYNNYMAEVLGASDRLKWVAVISLDDVPGAVAEMRRARTELGAIGVMIFGSIGEKDLDHRSFVPFWEAAADLNLPVSVHIGWCWPALNNRYETPLYTGTISFTLPLLFGFATIVGSGLLERFPNLRVGFFEAGCLWLHFMADRLEHYYGFGERLSKYFGVPGPGAKRTPLEYIRSGRIFINTEVEDPLLPQVIELIGEDQLLFSSDMPHGDRERFAARYLSGRTDVADDCKRKILWDNSIRYYGL